MDEDEQIAEWRLIQQKMNPEAFAMLLDLAREWLNDYPRENEPKLRLIVGSRR